MAQIFLIAFGKLVAGVYNKDNTVKTYQIALFYPFLLFWKKSFFL